jgi:hypothetical protein
MTGPKRFQRPVRPRRPLWRDYSFELGTAVAGVAALFAIFLAKAFRGDTVDPVAASQLGDFVGGFFGSFFVLVSVVLLVRTLREQGHAEHRERFENKYFELIKMHRDNVAEMLLENSPGRRVFVLLLKEWRKALDIARRHAIRDEQQLSDRQLLQIAYYAIFFGVGPNSFRMLSSYLEGFDVDFVQRLADELETEHVGRVRAQRTSAYKPFDGHQIRLGHYYRHLFQTMSYVDQADGFNDFEKYEYAKTIRAQLSTQEQALLLVNSLTPIGRAWWDDNLIIKYRLVKNLPKAFFDDTAEIDTSDLFPPGYFEWEEVGASVNQLA